jgi:ribose 5-phosphate isomerase A
VPDLNALKRVAAEAAVTEVESGMVIGLGAGSTAIHALNEIAVLLRAGTLTDILAIPCSLAVEIAAREAGIPLTSFETHPIIDLTIDGADEVDLQLNLIKGGGGALLREKIVAQASKQEIIVIDESKLSSQLGTKWALPVEVLPFGWHPQRDYLTSLRASVALRRDDAGQPLKTDQGNYILDADFGPINEPHILNEQLNQRVGILEHGLFLGLATKVIVAGVEGIRELTR